MWSREVGEEYRMSEAERPKKNPTDVKARDLRERAMDLVADAAIHAERLNGAARELGLTPDLVDGVGDYLYEAAVAQLDVASKILERSQVIADRLVDMASRRFETSRFTRVDVEHGHGGYLRFVVHNGAGHEATVEVQVESERSVGHIVKIGRSQLPPNRDTSIQVEIESKNLDPGAYAFLVQVWMRYRHARVALPTREFELWVVKT